MVTSSEDRNFDSSKVVAMFLTDPIVPDVEARRDSADGVRDLGFDRICR